VVFHRLQAQADHDVVLGPERFARFAAGELCVCNICLRNGIDYINARIAANAAACAKRGDRYAQSSRPRRRGAPLVPSREIPCAAIEIPAGYRAISARGVPRGCLPPDPRCQGGADPLPLRCKDCCIVATSAGGVLEKFPTQRNLSLDLGDEGWTEPLSAWREPKSESSRPGTHHRVESHDARCIRMGLGLASEIAAGALTAGPAGQRWRGGYEKPSGSAAVDARGGLHRTSGEGRAIRPPDEIR
jgi:hypothetical protein